MAAGGLEQSVVEFTTGEYDFLEVSKMRAEFFQWFPTNVLHEGMLV